MMPVIATAAAAGWAAVRYAENWRAGHGLLLVLLLGILLWLHGSTQFTAAAFLIFIFWEARARAGRWGLSVFIKCWPIVAGCLASVPLMILIHGHKIEEMKAEPARLGGLLRDMCELVFARSDLWPQCLGHTQFSLPDSPGYPADSDPRAGPPRTSRPGQSHDPSFPDGAHPGHSPGPDPGDKPGASSPRPGPLPGRLFHSPGDLPCPRLEYFLPEPPPPAPVPRRVGNDARRPGRRRARSTGETSNARPFSGIAARHSGREKILTSSATVNCFAFGYLGFPHPELVKGLALHKGGSSKMATKRSIRDLFAHERRGFILLYHDRGRILRDLTRPKKKNKDNIALAELEKEGFILADRQWRLGQSTAVIRLHSRCTPERAWLESLPAPPTSWGPASGALKPKERRRIDLVDLCLMAK